jgi:hypothetical protein
MAHSDNAPILALVALLGLLRVQLILVDVSVRVRIGTEQAVEEVSNGIGERHQFCSLHKSLVEVFGCACHQLTNANSLKTTEAHQAGDFQLQVFNHSHGDMTAWDTSPQLQ